VDAGPDYRYSTVTVMSAPARKVFDTGKPNIEIKPIAGANVTTGQR